MTGAANLPDIQTCFPDTDVVATDGQIPLSDAAFVRRDTDCGLPEPYSLPLAAKGQTADRPLLILVGGFLGAGKTTLLACAANRLLEQGERVGLITNDQAPDLVDTAFLRQHNFYVQEIAGGCFCCRFGQLIDTAARITAAISPHVIVGEPVGSCTDLSATVLQPIKDLYSNEYRLAPLSVLVDPFRLREAVVPGMHSPMHPSALYILRKQLEEADILLINKCDILNPQEVLELQTHVKAAFPGKTVYCISAINGDGVDKWLEGVRGDTERSGTRLIDVDYDIYAEGEAVLGWLNASATLKSAHGANWKRLAITILERIQMAATDRGAEIAHVKLVLTASTGQYTASLTSTYGIPIIRGGMADSPTDVSLVINARVEMSPGTLQGIVEEVLLAEGGGILDLEIETMQSLSPGRPVPTHRYASVV